MHENWGKRLRKGDNLTYGPKNLKLDFDEFEYGFVYKRVPEGSDESHPFWTIGRVALWPNAFFLGDQFEWRVPIDDENTLSVLWKLTHVPKDREPYVQKDIPARHGPVRDEQGRWITSHVMNQDFLGWVGQGASADRTKEHLGASHRGIVMVRRRLLEELDRVATAHDPKGIIRGPAKNVRVQLQWRTTAPACAASRLRRSWRARAAVRTSPASRCSTGSRIRFAGCSPKLRAWRLGSGGVAVRGTCEDGRTPRVNGTLRAHRFLDVNAFADYVAHVLRSLH